MMCVQKIMFGLKVDNSLDILPSLINPSHLQNEKDDFPKKFMKIGRFPAVQQFIFKRFLLVNNKIIIFKI